MGKSAKLRRGSDLVPVSSTRLTLAVGFDRHVGFSKHSGESDREARITKVVL